VRGKALFFPTYKSRAKSLILSYGSVSFALEIKPPEQMFLFVIKPFTDNKNFMISFGPYWQFKIIERNFFLDNENSSPILFACCLLF
jgi:hypothetical protein